MSDSKIILLVGDEPAARLSCARALEAECYRIIAVSSSKEAIDAVQRTPGIDLILLDTGMAALIASVRMAFELHDAREELKRKDEELRRSEERYRNLFDNMLDGYALHEIILDDLGAPVDYRFLAVNPAFERLTGLRANVIVGRTVREVLPDIELAWIERYGAVALTGKPAHFDQYHGSLNRHYEVSAFSPGARQFACTVVDITERKQAEKAIRESQAIMRTVIESTPDMIFMKDREGRYVLMNSSAAQSAAMPVGEVIGRLDSDIFPPPTARSMREVDKQVMSSGEPRTYEQIVPIDGGLQTMLTTKSVCRDGEGNIIGVMGIGRDITERKHREEELRESEERYRVAIENSTDGVTIVGDNRHLYTNQRFLDMFGYESLEEIAEKPAYAIVHPDDRERVFGYVRQGQRGEPTPRHYGFKGIRKDGTMIYIEASVSVITYRGRRAGLGYFRDVTDRKRLEEQLVQAQKMEAVGTLAGGIAHDFNNILTVIIGLGTLVSEAVQGDPMLMAHMDQILTSSEKAASLTQSLLAFSRKQRIVLEPHDVNETVRSGVKLLSRLLPEDIELRTDLTYEDAVVQLDVAQVHQVLMNLATNARDAMPRGGVLTIRTEGTTIDDGFRKIHGFGKPGRYVCLSVSDTGVGMDEETQKHIFDPFFTTKEVGKGTGLGLASVYGTVKQHEGYVTVSSRAFKGTTFHIYLPLAEATRPQTTPSVTQAARGTETILIVEDDPDVRNMLTTVLRTHGYVTMEAADGDSAIRTYESCMEKIELIVLDVVMPRKNGKDVLDEVMKIDPGVRAIFISGYTGDVVINRGVESDTVDFLFKPLSVTSLLTKVREVLDR